jgi:hypothetical protein
LPVKSLVVDNQRVTKSLIFAIFATTGQPRSQILQNTCLKKQRFSELVAKKATSMPKSRIQEMAFIPFSIIKQTYFEAHLATKKVKQSTDKTFTVIIPTTMTPVFYYRKS